MNDTKVIKAVFTPSETDHMIRCIDLAISSAKRGMNTAKQPEFKAIYDKTMVELQALSAKIKGLN